MLSWDTLIGLARSSGDSTSAASSTLREAQPEYRMYVRASWAVMCVYFYIACRRVRTDGRELFFEASGGMLMAVEVDQPDFYSGIPKPMFRLPAGTPDRGYDVPADGKKFLTSVMASLNTDAGPRPSRWF